MDKLFFIIFFFFIINSYSQRDTTKVGVQIIEEVVADKDFPLKYRRTLSKVRKMYPLAIYAAKELKALDAELADIESKRKKKKVAKKEHKELKAEFYYVIKDMYTSEGIILMKLIHRETGMTVKDILKKYRNNFKAEVSESLGKIWNQDLDIHYDPKGEDWIIERVIKDINSGNVIIDFTPKKTTKEEYKASQKQYKIDKRKAKKALRKKD